MNETSENYLICLDGSENSARAAQWASDLSVRTDARLTLLHVVTWDSHSWIHAGQLAELPGLHDRLEAQAWSEVLTPMEKQLCDAGRTVESRLVFGRPAESVGRVAKEVGATLIVAGTRGHSTLEGLVVGSTSHRLLHTAPCPVVVVP